TLGRLAGWEHRGDAEGDQRTPEHPSHNPPSLVRARSDECLDDARWDSEQGATGRAFDDRADSECGREQRVDPPQLLRASPPAAWDGPRGVCRAGHGRDLRTVVMSHPSN